MGFLFQIDQPDYFVFIQGQGDDIIVLSVFRAEGNILRRETDPSAFWGSWHVKSSLFSTYVDYNPQKRKVNT